ncbi:MAG: penicillin-binding transpeptidase domain-containing protein [Clostridium sp.]|nr:penicillin-binding transpeptidase domain-containing protein [Clostridium sp.]
MKNKKNIYIVAGVLIVIVPLIICICAWYIYNSTHNPEAKWNEYVTMLQNGQYEDMYELLDSSAKAKVSKEDFVARNKNIYSGIEAENIEVNITGKEKDGSSSVISYDTSMDTAAGEITFSNKVKLSKELGKGYGVVWNSKLIFPELDDGDKVRINTLKSRRGDITDRNGVLLATDSYLSNVGIVPGKLGEDKSGSINKIASILGISADKINNALSADYVKDDMFIPIKDIPYGSEKVVSLLEVPGVMIKEKDSRVYDYGTETAHLVGYVQSINADELNDKKDQDYNENSIIGKAGLEKYYEDSLRGIDGAEIYIQNSEGERKTTIATKEAKNGTNLCLNIDINIQKKLYEQLGNDKGTAVVMNPNNGEVLGLASTPSYNSNDFILGLSDEQWNNLNNDPNKPLYNRFQSTAAPGSSFKPITAVIGVDTGKIDPEADKKISGLSWQKDNSWGNYNVTRVSEYGEANMTNALIYSDNIYFAQAALDIGKDTFKEELNNFGIGEKIPFEYPLYNSQISSSGDFTSEVQLADSGYGQGEVMMNPVQLASLYTMFENDGSILTPVLTKTDGSTPKVWKENAASKESSDLVLNDLKQIVENPAGTGHQAYTPGLEIAGKTGTAEIKQSQDDTTGTELGWFVGMTTNKAPDNLLVVMMIEDVKDRGASHYVVPKVKSILELAQ